MKYNASHKCWATHVILNFRVITFLKKWKQRRQRAQRIFRVVSLWIYSLWYHDGEYVIRHWPIHSMYNTKSSIVINVPSGGGCPQWGRLWGEGTGGGIWELSILLSAQFCCESKTALKNKFINLKNYRLLKSEKNSVINVNNILTQYIKKITSTCNLYNN